MLLETIQQLRTEMDSLQENNERLMHVQEKILKSIFDHQDYCNFVPKSSDNHRDEEQRYRGENFPEGIHTQHLEGDKGRNE